MLPRATLLLWAGCVALGFAQRSETSGPKAPSSEQVGELIERLESEVPMQRARAAYELGRLGREGKAAVPRLTKSLRDKHTGVAAVAALALGRMGVGAEPAVPALVEMLGEDHVGPYAREALSAIGPAAIDPLIEALEPPEWEHFKQQNPEVPVAQHIEMFRRRCDARGAAATVLGMMGPQANKAIPALIGVLENDARYGSNAAEALARVGQEAVEPLIKVTNSDEEEVRELGADALRRMGSAAKAAVPALVRLLRDKDDSVRLDAAEALLVVEPDHPAALQVFLKEVEEGASFEYIGFELLEAVGPKTKAALVPVMRERLGREDVAVQLDAVRVLARLGQSGIGAEPDLRALLDSEDDELRAEADRALRKIRERRNNPPDEGQTRRLVQQLSWDSVGYRHSFLILVPRPDGPAARALIDVGKPGTHELLAVLEDENRAAAAHLVLTAIWTPDAVGETSEKYLFDGDEVIGWTRLCGSLRWTYSSAKGNVTDPVDRFANAVFWRVKTGAAW